MVELVGVNDSREINDGKLLIELRDKVVVEAESEEVEDVLLVDDEDYYLFNYTKSSTTKYQLRNNATKLKTNFN